MTKRGWYKLIDMQEDSHYNNRKNLQIEIEYGRKQWDGKKLDYICFHIEKPYPAERCGLPRRRTRRVLFQMNFVFWV